MTEWNKVPTPGGPVVVVTTVRDPQAEIVITTVVDQKDEFAETQAKSMKNISL